MATDRTPERRAPEGRAAGSRLPEGHHPPSRAPAPVVLLDQPFTEQDLPALRRTVAAHAGRVPLPAGRAADLVLIVSELASNAIRHGGGKGRVRLWATGDAVHCEVSDAGAGFSHPHALPRQRPEPTAAGGRGLWLVRAFADDLAVGNADGGGVVATVTLRLAQADR